MKTTKISAAKSIASLLLVAVTTTACQTTQTTPYAPARTPAAAPIDPKTAELAEALAVEALGVAAHWVLLQDKLARAEIAPTLNVPNPIQPDFLTAGGTAVSLGVASSWVNFMFIVSMERDTPASAKSLHWLALRTPGRPHTMASAGVLAVPLGSVTTAITFGSTFTDMNDPKNPMVSAQFFINRSEQIAQAEKVSEAANAEVRTQFEARLKKSSAEIAKRMGTLLHLSISEEAALRSKIQGQILDAFHTKESWKRESEIRINLQALLRSVIPDSEKRIAALRAVVGADASRPVPAYADVATLAEAIEGLRKEMKTLNVSAVENFEKYRENTNAPQRALSREFFALSKKIESLDGRLEQASALLLEDPKGLRK
jgi:hypothetical protein